MKKLLIAASAGALALSLASCGGSETKCTPEILAQKQKDLQAAVQAAVMKDPTKAQTLMTKVQEIVGKYKDAKADSPEACKAMDDVIAAAKAL